MSERTYTGKVTLNMPDHDYRALPGLSHSSLRRWVKGEEPSGSSASLVLGTALHTMVLEPKAAKDRYFTFSRDFDGRRKEDQEAMASEVEANGGKVGLKPKQREALVEWYKALRADETIRAIVEVDRPVEVVCEAEMQGVACKGKLDKVCKTLIVDLKTTHASDADEFRDSIVRFGYASQAAYYSRLWAECNGGEWRRFAFVCVSTRVAGNVWVAEVTPEQLAFGESWVSDMLTVYKRHNEGDKP